MLEVDQEVIKDDLRHLLFLHVYLLGVYLFHALTTLESGWAGGLLLLYFRCDMKDFIDDLKKMVGAPLLVVAHHILENAVHLDHNVHLHQLCEFNLARLNYCSHKFYCESVELWMVHLEILENYIDELENGEYDILGMSALLTTTMPYMKVVIDTMVEKGIRNDYVVLVGGAPLNEAFADSVGADAYCRDAAVAVETAKEWMSRRQGTALAAG